MMLMGPPQRRCEGAQVVPTARHLFRPLNDEHGIRQYHCRDCEVALVRPKAEGDR